MFDDRLEDRLRSALRQTGNELRLSVTAAELERRLTVRRRARAAQRSVLVAAAIGIVAVGALVASAPSWFRQVPNQVASTASPGATIAPSSTSPLPSSALASAPAAEAPTPSASLSIRYRTRSGQAFEIAIDGTGRRRAPTYDLAPGAIEPGLPHGSSGDGRFIASANGDVVTIARADGELESHIAVPRLKGDEQTDFEWSPDSRFIAVWRSDDRRMNAPHYLWMVDIANQQTTVGPIRSIGRPSSSAWSPDSRLYAFGFWDGLKVLTAATGALNVYQKPGHESGGYIGVAWSPDSRWITFIPFEAGNGEIYRINADASGPTRLASGASAVWSPDGSRIASTRRSDGPAGAGSVFEIWTMAPDGSDQRLLASKPCPCGDEVWSPDGQWVKFETSHGTRDEVWIVRANGGAARRLAKNAYFLEWVSP
jgi:Tol biopolymer transport system component